MLTKTDFKKLEEKFATKADLKKLREIFITKIDFKKFSDVMVREFKTVIEILGDISSKFDRKNKTIDDHSKTLSEHDERIRNVEHKVFRQI